MPEPLVPREDARATLEARRELGAELEPELVDSFVERIERRLEERAKPTRSPARAPDWGGVVLGICSLGLAIPLIAVAAEKAGSLAVLAVCALLIAVNAFYHDQSN